MNPKKPSKISKKDEDRQKQIEERTKAEKVELDHPKGKECFIEIVKRMGKKKGN